VTRGLHARVRVRAAWTDSTGGGEPIDVTLTAVDRNLIGAAQRRRGWADVISKHDSITRP